jgi:hypothetical protein
MSDTYKQAPRLIHRGKKFSNPNKYHYQLPTDLMSIIFNELDGKHGNQIKLMCVLIGTSGDGNFRISRKWITDQTGMDETAYSRARSALKDRGWLTLENGCLYVNFDAIRIRNPVAPSVVKAPLSNDDWGDEISGHKKLSSSLKSDADVSCEKEDTSDRRRDADTTAIIYNNIKEYKCDEIKSSAPQAAGPRTVVVPIKETPRKKNELPYDFLDD